MASPGKKSYPLRIDPALWDELQRLAARDLRSVNAEIEFLLREGLARRGVKLKEGTAKMTGTFKVGSTVKINPTGWAAGNSYHYQWTANGARLKGATSKTYKLRRADKGKAIECVVTVKRPGYATISVSSGTRGVR